MNVYSIDVMICATAYIKAETEAEAQAIALGLKDSALELYEQEGEVPISGKDLDNPDLPDVSFSPAMSVKGPVEGVTVDLAEEGVTEESES